MASTLTRTLTETTSFPKIVYVTRKVQADFLAILETYGYFSEDYAHRLITDVRTLLDEEVIDRVNFVWTAVESTRVIEAFSYEVILNGLGLADDRSGGIRHNSDLAGAEFHVRVFYNERWRTMEEDERRQIPLLLTWSVGGQLDYSSGYWSSDRTYSTEGYALARKRFKS